MQIKQIEYILAHKENSKPRDTCQEENMCMRQKGSPRDSYARFTNIPSLTEHQTYGKDKRLEWFGHYKGNFRKKKKYLSRPNSKQRENSSQLKGAEGFSIVPDRS